jgi:alpha-D-xyloside xylohydrolase
MTFDPVRLAAVERPVFSRATDAGLVFDTEAGPLEVVAYAPGIFRVRLGDGAGFDYGLLAEAAARVEATVEHGEGGGRIATPHGTLVVEGAPLRISVDRGGRPLVRAATDAHFRRRHRLPPFAKAPGGDGADEGWFAAFDLQSGEPVYGLGEKWGKLDRRGQLVVSRNEDALGVNAEISYKNCPFAWSPRGWGLFVHTPAPVTHGVGHAQWSQRSYGVRVEDGALDLFLFAGEDGAAVLERYTWLTGRPPLVPRWSLGVWMSRAYYRTAEEAMSVANEIRRRRIPCDVFTLDGRAWLKVETRFAFQWDEERYPDPEAFSRFLHRLGFRLCVWEYPYVSVHNPLFDEMAAKGWLLKDPATGEPWRLEWDQAPFGEVLTPLPTSGMVDFTNADAYDDWRDRHEALFRVGVDVVKTDFGEQIPDGCVAANGDRGRRLHNVYPLLYNACVYEATARFHDGAPMVFGRSGWAGSQRFPMQWGGDPQADWEGFAASIRGGLSWGMSGVPWWASDIGGFYGDQPDAELYVRWSQQAVFSSHMRFHGIGAREPWAFGEEAETIVRNWLEFRYRLIPYVEGVLEQAHDTGLPAMRAMPLAFPDDPAAWGFETQYMLGPALLVAPVVQPGGRVRAYLPAGGWYDVWSGERIEGGRVLDLQVPLDRIPVFGRDGESVPLGPIAQSTREIPADKRVDGLWVFGHPLHPPLCGEHRTTLVRQPSGPTMLVGLPPNVPVREFGEVSPEILSDAILFHR